MTEDGRSRGLRPLLQPDEPADHVGGAGQLPPADGDHRQPDVPGSVRRPRSADLRLDRRRPTSRSMADNLENLQSAAYTVGVSQALDLCARDPRRRRLQQDDEGPDGDRHQPAQRRHDRHASAAAVRAACCRRSRSGSWTTRRCSCASRSGSITTTCTLVSYTLADTNGNVNASGGTQSVDRRFGAHQLRRAVRTTATGATRW